MSRSLLRRLLGVGRGEEVRLARAEIARDAFDAGRDERRELEAFGREMDARIRVPHVTLGTSPNGVPYRMRLADLASAHLWVSGSTGSGKTRLATLLVRELLAAALAGERVSVIVVAMQGNFGELALRTAGELLAHAPAGRRDAMLSRTRVARFFRGTHLPELNILLPSRGAPALVQAGAIAEVVETSLGAALGGRQETALTMIFALALEAGLTVNEVRLLLAAPQLLQARGAASSEPLVAAYFSGRFQKEGAATLDGIASRLDRLLGIDASLRGALAGPGNVDFEALFEPGSLTVFDFSSSPLGAEGARRALAALVIQSLASAAVSASRRPSGGTFVLLDEVQLALTPALTRAFETGLATFRQFGVGLTFINQSLAQLPHDLVHLLATNIRWRFLGRSGRADALLSEEFLPRTGRLTRGGRALPPGEEREARVAEVGNLPERHFLACERTAPFGTQPIVASAIDPAPLGRLPPVLREALERGATGRPRAELIAHAQAIEANALAAVRAANAAAPASRTARGRAAPTTPDAAGAARAWKARRTP